MGPRLDTSPESLQRDDVRLAVPSDSGTGRRVVFDMSEQHVWLVRDNGRAARSYPVSGSVYDNRDPGTYEVYSRSEQAYAFDGSGSALSCHVSPWPKTTTSPRSRSSASCQTLATTRSPVSRVGS